MLTLLCKQERVNDSMPTKVYLNLGQLQISCKGAHSLTLPVPCISESCIKIKIKLNLYFHTQKCENKNLTYFFPFDRDWDGKG